MSTKLRGRIESVLNNILKECDRRNRYQLAVEYTSPLGSAVRESTRKVDIAILRTEKDERKPYLYIECKEQNTRGTAEEKLFRALEEAKRDRLLGVHSIVIFSGRGFQPSYERWAMVEGFVHEEYAELWLRRFFCK